MTHKQRYEYIRDIILAAEQRAMAVDGPVGKTIHAMTDGDIKRIYQMATCGLVPTKKNTRTKTK